jgi:hypothetical protein
MWHTWLSLNISTTYTHCLNGTLQRLPSVPSVPTEYTEATGSDDICDYPRPEFPFDGLRILSPRPASRSVLHKLGIGAVCEWSAVRYPTPKASWWGGAIPSPLVPLANAALPRKNKSSERELVALLVPAHPFRQSRNHATSCRGAAIGSRHIDSGRLVKRALCGESR